MKHTGVFFAVHEMSSHCLTTLLSLVAVGFCTASAATSIQLSAPLDYQVVQRSSPSEGGVPIALTLAGDSKLPDVLEARWVGESGSGVWQSLRLRAGGACDSTLMTPAGGWYRIEVRARDGGEVVARTQVDHVGVGEVLVVSGQSNSANHGEERQRVRTGMVATFDGKAWRLADDPQPGATGDAGSFLPPLGDLLAVRWKVPVGFVSTGVGATSVREWLPAGVRFPNPPTLTGNVRQLPGGEWESTGELYKRLNARIRSLGPRGFRAVLWHQGESDANQRDTTRTLPGSLYRKYLEQLIEGSRAEAGWPAPWFVAQVSYHTPDDPGSEDIRAAQKALWESGVALQGPDSDALAGDFRDGAGKGVHFSGKGLREHAQRWSDRVGPWLESQPGYAPVAKSTTKTQSAPGRLDLPRDNFEIQGRPAFVFLPPESKRRQPQPWIFYAPTLPPYPDEAERWMHEQFLAAGIAVAGVDVGEAYGSPASHRVFDALYQELTSKRGFSPRLCLFGRSRGGLWVGSWAITHPERIAGLIGIYPVFDFRTYPGVDKAAPAYGVAPDELVRRNAEWNPIERVAELAKARVPVALIHGDMDQVVPLEPNSARFLKQYESTGQGGLVKLIVLKGQGHNFYEGFFHSQELVDFAIQRASEGAR